MAQRFDDWSPASVFGATSLSLTRRQASERGDLTQRERQPRRKSGRSSNAGQGCSVGLLPEPAKQESLMRILGGEGTQDDRTDSNNPYSRYPTRQRGRSMQQNDSRYQEDTDEGVHLARSKSRFPRRNSAHRTRREDTRDGQNTQRGPTYSSASNERQFAAIAIQRHVRVFILRKRERDSLQHVDALRRVLTEAAAQLSIQSFRRYRSRLAVRNYLRSWWEQEAHIKVLLARIRTKKQSRAAQLASERSSRDAQAHHHTRCAKLIWDWYAGQTLPRKCREKRKQFAIQVVAQRQLAWWFRRLCLEQRCRSRRQCNQQMHIASQILQRFVRSVIRRQRDHNIRHLQAASAITVFFRRVAARKQWRIQDSERRSRLCIAQFCNQRTRIRRARVELRCRRQVIAGAIILSEYLSKHELQRALRHWSLQCAELRQQEQLRLNASAKALQHLFRGIVAAARRRHRRESAIHIQTAFRGYCARKDVHELRRRRSKAAKHQKKRTATIRVQAHWRGCLARWKFAVLLKRMRDRFRCANCGVIEPSGVYCKLCGRKRTNFEPLTMAGAYTVALRSHPHKPTKLAAPTSTCVPVRPTSPPPFAALQARKNGTIRRISGRTAAAKSSNNQMEQTAPEIPVLAPLRVTLSPRQRKDPHPRKSTPRSSNQLLVQHRSSSTHPELLQAPVRPQSDRAIVAGNATKLRAQELAKYQALREHKGQSQALAQHLHRLHNANEVLSRSR